MLYVSTQIKMLQQVGHILRMDNIRKQKKVLNGEFHGRRPVGRPRL
jgi:hypothetical protein